MHGSEGGEGSTLPDPYHDDCYLGVSLTEARLADGIIRPERRNCSSTAWQVFAVVVAGCDQGEPPRQTATSALWRRSIRYTEAGGRLNNTLPMRTALRSSCSSKWRGNGQRGP